MNVAEGILAGATIVGLLESDSVRAAGRRIARIFRKNKKAKKRHAGEVLVKTRDRRKPL